MKNVFVGIGFGPIQSGLFLLEAQASGNFERLVVVEVQPEIVDAVRRNGGRVAINVAHHDGISTHELHGIEIFNPRDPADVPQIVEAIACSDEITTALPSIDFFQRGHPSSAELLARGFERKSANRNLPRAIVYTAENHNHAAEALSDSVLEAISAADRPRLSNHVAFLNTVIGKMSGVVSDALQIERDGLVPFIDGTNYAVLVEQFNRILISRIPWPEFQRGIQVFREKSDLLPFEEAKLYGHNAAHALLGYLANREGLTYIGDTDSTLREFVERAFLEESGGALCQRHRGIDPLFTTAGWADYARDLGERMVNPYLRDRVDRVIRDPSRKLAWNDRLVGTIRLAMEHGVEPQRFALGAAAAAEILLRTNPQTSIPSLLTDLWQSETASEVERNQVIQRIQQAGNHRFAHPSRPL